MSVDSTLLVTSHTEHTTGGLCLHPLCFPTALSHGCSHTSPPLASSEQGGEFPQPLSLERFHFVGMIQALMIPALWTVSGGWKSSVQSHQQSSWLSLSQRGHAGAQSPLPMVSRVWRRPCESECLLSTDGSEAPQHGGLTAALGVEVS